MIGFQLTCGACGGAPLTPNDEGSAPELDVIDDEAQGKWKLNLNDMGCPGIEAAWPAFDARPNDDVSWHDEWDELCERHYSTWQLSVLDSDVGAQELTQHVSEPFSVVGTMTARLDDGGVVELEDVDVLPDPEEDDHGRHPFGRGGTCRNCSRLVLQCGVSSCGIGFVHMNGSHYCDDPPVHGWVVVDGWARVRFAELDPAT